MTNSGTAARHRLSQRHFHALAAGGGDESTVCELLTVERSWRLAQLRALLDAIRAHPDAQGPLPPVDHAWELLVAAERRAPSEVAKLLLHPLVGIWSAYTLRRLRNVTAVDAPMWVDVGYLHALAAVAGSRAGLDFMIRVPARDGFVILPTLGAAELPVRARWDQAEVRASAGAATVVDLAGRTRVPVGGEAAAGWLGIPRIRAKAAGGVLAVSLDSLDPYRNLRTPTPPQRLSEAQVAKWRELLGQAWQIIDETCPALAAPLARGLSTLVPQPGTERFRTMSASAGDAFGCMIVSEVYDAAELAVTMVHEFQHIKLGSLLHLTPLRRGEPPQRLYAPWRDDPRPLSGLLQGVYAFAGITEFWRALRRLATGSTAHLAQFEFARWRRQVWATLRMMGELPQLTEVGRRFLAGLTTTATGWRDEPVPAEILALADAAVADHRAQWRLHHLRPDPGLVATLAAAWQAGQDPPRCDYPDPVVVADKAARHLDTRAALMLWRLTDPHGFAQLWRQSSMVGERVVSAAPADLAYVAGERDYARDLYLAQVSAQPDQHSPWAALGLTLVDDGAWQAAAGALRDRPELVRAVYQAVHEAGASAAPLDVAGWVGETLATR